MEKLVKLSTLKPQKREMEKGKEEKSTKSQLSFPNLRHDSE